VVKKPAEEAHMFQSPKGRLRTGRELGKSYEEQMDKVSSCYKLFLLYPTSSRKSTCAKNFLLLSTPRGFWGIAGRQQLENTKFKKSLIYQVQNLKYQKTT